ncbi:MAG TPA: VTT domain-containing protein [Dehalococcoidia bacterium]|jgi:membrane protein YqaA with SNARE-associated domain|nr:VTT domain-containing protein [Dehalococcoidia bacterium]
MSEEASAFERLESTFEEQVEVLREESVRRGWFRLEYAIFFGLFILFGVYVVAYFVVGIDLDALKDWGYLGVFFIAMAGSATIVLPTPSSVAIFGSAIILDPVFGIPTPIMVGLVAGLGDAIGEFSGYGLGFAGADVLRHQRAYALFEGWMRRNGTATIFLLSTFPNPLFDVAGAAAGATRMPPLRFFLATLAGKIVKDLFLAYGGTFSAGLWQDWF